jgi:hypothetical protein
MPPLPAASNVADTSEAGRAASRDHLGSSIILGKLVPHPRMAAAISRTAATANRIRARRMFLYFCTTMRLTTHVLACLTGHADSLIEPASALPALELTLDVHQRLTSQRTR